MRKMHRKVCSNEGRHTPCPEDYLAWHQWVERKAKTHTQHQCPDCGLHAIWKPKEKEPV